MDWEVPQKLQPSIVKLIHKSWHLMYMAILYMKNENAMYICWNKWNNIRKKSSLVSKQNKTTIILMQNQIVLMTMTPLRSYWDEKTNWVGGIRLVIDGE